MTKSKADFESDAWRLRCLLQDALLRRLSDDGVEGAPRMAAAEISAAVNLVKLIGGTAPDELTDANLFDGLPGGITDED